jgi:hypothetical protein
MSSAYKFILQTYLANLFQRYEFFIISIGDLVQILY